MKYILALLAVTSADLSAGVDYMSINTKPAALGNNLQDIALDFSNAEDGVDWVVSVIPDTSYVITVTKTDDDIVFSPTTEQGWGEVSKFTAVTDYGGITTAKYGTDTSNWQ